MPQINEPVFLDIPLSFTAHPVTGNVVMLKNTDAVRQAVKNIVLSNLYDRPYNPLLGSDTVAQLFENFDSFTQYTIVKNIKTALKNFEPRVRVNDVLVEGTETNELRVTVKFTILNNIAPVEVSVFIDRVR